MAAPADAIFVDGEVHVDPGSGRTEEALAVRDGTVCRVADTYEVEFLEGVETRRVDLDGRTVVPGFVDGWADLHRAGRKGHEGPDGGPRATGSGSVDPSRDSLEAAIEGALERGLTTVFDTVSRSETARAYHELALSNALPLRVRLQYRQPVEDGDSSPPLAAARRLGLVSGAGTEPLRVESVQLEAGDHDESTLAALLETATDAGIRVSAHAVDGSDFARLLAALGRVETLPPRIRYDGPVTDGQIEVLAATRATVVGNPASEPESGHHANPPEGPPFGRLAASGIPFAFGSDGGRLDPLRAIEQATATGPDRRLAVTEALRAATGMGPATTAGIGTGSLDVDAPADFVVLSASPWETPIAELSVDLTIVDGTIEFEGS